MAASKRMKLGKTPDQVYNIYHPHLNVSHYVNPKGMGITNTNSRAAAVIHGYSHIKAV